VNGDNLFLTCLSTTLKLLHNYKFSKGMYIARESENVSLYCHVLAWFEEKWEKCRFFTFSAVTSFAQSKWPMLL